MIERLLESIPDDIIVYVMCAIVAFYVAIAGLALAIVVVGICWLVDRRRSRIIIEEGDEFFAGANAASGKRAELLGASALLRSIELAVEEAFYRAATPDHIARAFSTGAQRLTADDVEAIWRDAKIAGRLPDLRRPLYRDRARWLSADRASDLAWRNAP